MIARITLVALAVATWGLLSHVASAQSGPTYPVSAVSFNHGDAEPAEVGCAECGDVSCCDTGCCDGGGCNGGCDDGWLTGWRLGLKHQPNCCCPWCRPRHSWASFDVLMWWGKGRSVPPLVTTNPNDGVLPDATILFGNGDVGNQMAAGARTDFGFWLDECETLGLGAKIWGIDGDDSSYHVESSAAGDPLLARPFTNVFLDGEDALLIAAPGVLSATMDVETSSSVLAVEAYLRSSIMAGRGYNIDLLGGYHFLRLDDELSIHSLGESLDPSSGQAVGTTIDLLDMFDTQNEFHGGELGIVSEIRYRQLTLLGLAKMSVGNMHQSVRIDGATTVTTPNNPSTTTQGGMLALPTNMGTFSRDQTAWIPEVGITAAYEVRSWLRLSAGYTAIWMSDVVFSGDQIDMTVNPSQFNGGVLIPPPSPLFAFRDTEYWLHGMTLGVTLSY